MGKFNQGNEWGCQPKCRNFCGVNRGVKLGSCLLDNVCGLFNITT